MENQVDNITMNAKELLLLCAIRGRIVKAQNVSEYSWTYRHFYYVQQKFFDLAAAFYPKSEEIKEEARAKYGIKKSEERMFFAKEYAEGISLSEHTDNDLIWYEPIAAEHALDWSYKGSFLILEPVSTREKRIIKTCCK